MATAPLMLLIYIYIVFFVSIALKAVCEELEMLNRDF